MTLNIDDMASFCKRKGFIYPSAEIYGGLAGFFDYGPYGVELKKNIINEWWKFMVNSRSDVVGMDGSIISPESVWQASGHLENFSDLMLVSEDGSFEVRADVFLEEKLGKSFDGVSADEVNNLIKDNNLTGPNGKKFKTCESFNLMFPLSIGAKKVKGYLRGETTQMIYLDYKLIQQNARMKVPFGIAQIGKAFRNEISPRNFLFRCREFEQMEMQFFIDPKDRETWFKYWQEQRTNFYLNLGVKREHLRYRAHEKGELAHYAKRAEDIEYKFPFGWKEIEGIHDRGDWDLSTHSKHSKQKLDYFDEEKKESFVPHIIETSAGLDRTLLLLLYEAYEDDKERGNIVLRLHPKLAPIKVAVLPLVKKGGLKEKAQELFDSLKLDFVAFYDESGSIGRRYARMDEIGTPYCVTIDFDTLEDGTVTIRNRDTTEQKRVKIEDLRKELVF
ncbi:glycine--tRNA ligase [Candidatus Woesearchaeota archaeon]|nr:glycine--tRNA ligase [Candidatus Woesearchaeota archaeon]MCF8013028.1 glycine--tRNA ligase [Candidatus Woesearchaeota archaeon]